MLLYHLHQAGYVLLLVGLCVYLFILQDSTTFHWTVCHDTWWKDAGRVREEDITFRCGYRSGDQGISFSLSLTLQDSVFQRFHHFPREQFMDHKGPMMSVWNWCSLIEFKETVWPWWREMVNALSSALWIVGECDFYCKVLWVVQKVKIHFFLFR